MSFANNPESIRATEDLQPINERLFRTSAAILRLAIGRFDVHGQKNIIDEPAVYMASHRSMIDIPPVGISLLDAGHDPARFVTKVELWDKHKYPVPGLIWWLNQGGALPVTREGENPGKSRNELKRFTKAASDGEDVIIFGEGTRQEGPMIESIKAGPLIIAHRAERPLIPVGIQGTKPFRRGKIQVVFGKPFMPDEVAALHKIRKSGGVETVRERLDIVFKKAGEYLQLA